MARFKNVDGTRIQLSPQEELEFDAREAEWEAGADARAAATERSKRNKLLKTEIDPIVMNSLRWGDLSPAEQAALGVYRQELLDVPQQASFPKTHTWPNKP